MSPLIPVLILLVGAAAVLLGWGVPQAAFPATLALSATTGAMLALLALGWYLPQTTVFSLWGPTSLFPVGLQLQVDGLAWLFGLTILTLTLATLLTGLARPGGRRTLLRAFVLALAATGLMAVLSDNLLTRILAWAGLDLVYFLALILLTRGEGIEPQAVLNLSFNSAGTLCAVAAALLISRTSPDLSLQDAALTAQSTLFITAAAVFRLGLFPLHLGLPTETNVRQGMGLVLRFIPAVVALEMMARLATFGFAEPARPWLIAFGLSAMVVGAVQYWRAEEPRQGLTYVVIAQSGLCLLAGLYGGALALTAQTIALVCGGALLYLAAGHEEAAPGRTVVSLFGVAAMLGLPLTAGFLGAGAVYGRLVMGGEWLTLIVVSVAQTLLLAGLLRMAFWPAQPLENGRWAAVSYSFGLGLPFIFILIMGVAGRALMGETVGWFGWVGMESAWALGVALLCLALGIGLWRLEAVVRARAETVGNSVVSLLRLAWLYRAMWGVFRVLSGVVLNLAEVVEGEGAILWVLVVGLLLWLGFQGGL